MNEQTHKNGQQNLLLKNFIQISISLCLKAKRTPLATLAYRVRSYRYLAKHMVKFKMSI